MATQWSATEYAKNVQHHRRHDAEFMRDIHPSKHWNILDVGCGIGDFTEQLCDLVPEGQVVGIDSSKEMIELASKRKRDNLQFRLASAEKLIGMELGGPFDLVVSRACLHWVRLSDHASVLAGMAEQLRAGGRMRLEFGGAGNIARTMKQMVSVGSKQTYKSYLPNSLIPWDFPTPGQYLEFVMNSEFEEESANVWSVAQLRSMGDEQGLRSWFTSQVAISVTRYLPRELRKQYEDDVMREIMPLCRRADGSTAEIYVRLNVDAVKTRRNTVL